MSFSKTKECPDTGEALEMAPCGISSSAARSTSSVTISLVDFSTLTYEDKQGTRLKSIQRTFNRKSINQSINQSINRTKNNQSINQSINRLIESIILIWKKIKFDAIYVSDAPKNIHKFNNKELELMGKSTQQVALFEIWKKWFQNENQNMFVEIFWKITSESPFFSFRIFLSIMSWKNL